MEYFFVIDIFCKESDKKLLYDTIMEMIIRNIPKCIIFAIEKIIVK